MRWLPLMERPGIEAEVLGAHRRSIEVQQAPALEDAVDDGGGEVIVVQHGAPVVGMLVRGDDATLVRDVAQGAARRAPRGGGDHDGGGGGVPGPA
jgi:hypothetical protein